MKNELIEFSKFVSENVNRIDDVVDSYTENIKDITDTAGDLLKPIKAFVSVYNMARKIKFKRFLKAYSKGLNKNYPESDKKTLSSKLKTYLDDERNLNYIYDTIDGALNSKSVNCSGILGYLASEILSKHKDIGYRELIFLNALKNINDIELDMTILIFENTTDWTTNNTVAKNESLRPHQTYCEHTVQKLKSLHVFDEVHGRPGHPVSLGSSFWGTYSFSEFSKAFFQLLKDSGYYEEYKLKVVDK